MNNITTTLPAKSVLDTLVDSLENIDPDTPAGGLILHIVTGLLEMQLSLEGDR